MWFSRGFTRSERWAEAAIMLMYLAAQMAYRFIAGVRFDILPLYSFLQYLDPALLREDLLASLWYQHAQPPLMCLIVGVVLKLFPIYFALAFETVYFVAGGVAVWLLNRGMLQLGLRSWIRIAVLGQLCLFPTYYFYGHWLYTSQLEFCLCAWFVYCVIGFMYRETAATAKDTAGLILPLCLLGLLRPQWHLSILVAVVLVIFYYRNPRGNGGAYVAGMCVFLPLVLLYAKNFFVFGFFGASSWLGLNLSGAVSEALTAQMHAQLVEEGAISHDYPANFEYMPAMHRYVAWREVHPDAMLYDHPVLEPVQSRPEKINYNAMIYLISAEEELRDSWAVLQRYPWEVMAAVLKKAVVTLRKPALEHDCCRVGMRWLLGPWHAPWRHFLVVGISVMTVLYYGVVPMGLGAMALWKVGFAGEKRAVILPLLLLAVGMYLLSCVFNGGEQERMRWGQGPIYLLLLGMVLEGIMRARGINLIANDSQLR